jgi:hypothetical protein
MDYRNQIEPQQGEVDQIILRNWFAAHVSVDEAESTESPRSAPESSNVGKLKMRGVSKNDVADNPVARNQYADLPSKFSGECGQMLGQLRRNDLPGMNAPPECPFKRASLGLFDSEYVAVYRLYICAPICEVKAKYINKVPGVRKLACAITLRQLVAARFSSYKSSEYGFMQQCRNEN